MSHDVMSITITMMVSPASMCNCNHLVIINFHSIVTTIWINFLNLSEYWIVSAYILSVCLSIRLYNIFSAYLTEFEYSIRDPTSHTARFYCEWITNTIQNNWNTITNDVAVCAVPAKRRHEHAVRRQYGQSCQPPVCCASCCKRNQSICVSIHEPTSLSVNRPINQPFNQSMDWPVC